LSFGIYGMIMSASVQAHIFYSGMVQGVGFRYTVVRFTQGRPLSGWVRNLPDGRVEVLVEGERAQVDTLTQNVEDHFKTQITDKKISYAPAQAQFRDFRIVR